MERILPENGVPADLQHLEKHAHTVSKRTDARTLGVRPDHRYLLHFQSRLSCQKKQLGVESPPLNALQREDGLCSSAGKCFESALCVFETQAEENSE